MRVGFIAFGLLLGWSVMAHPAQAGVAVTSANRTWETSAKLGAVTEPIQLFGALGTTGDARFYQLTVKKIGTLSAAIDVPVWADEKFHPQLVVYQPDSATVGPALPMIQPPGTIALVYPLTENTRHFEAWTQITTVKRLQAKLDVPVTGTYYLAVYNADRAGGRFRLTVSSPSATNSGGILAWPKGWWVSQMWANPTIMTLFAPLVLIGIVMAAVWTGTHWTRPAAPARQKKRKY